MQVINIGVVTVSDRASNGVYEDISGLTIQNCLSRYLQSTFTIIYHCIPDEQEKIAHQLIELADKQNCCLIITTGGTGPAKRDVTPEATEQVCDKMIPGFGELMRQVSLQHVPTAILSRQTAGIRGQSLIINLPGKPTSIQTCLEAIFPAIPYCIDLLNGPYLICNDAAIKAFRPPLSLSTPLVSKL